MKLMPMLTVAALAIAVVASVFAIWPVVADAPWEDDAAQIEAINCEKALELRNELFLGQAITDFGQERYSALLTQAVTEIERYCGGALAPLGGD